MSLFPDSAAQLQAYGQLAIGFAGFAGVIGAFSHFRMHAQATAFRVRAMVVLALGEALFSLLPSLIASYGVSDTVTWRFAGGALAVASTAMIIVLARQASILYRVGRLMKTAAYVLCVAGVIGVTPLYFAALGLIDRYAAGSYFAMMFFGVIVCSYHFTMLIIAVRLDESDKGSVAPGAEGERRPR
jgi:hypothetical protein